MKISVLDWRRKQSWLRAIPKYASDLLTANVREHLAATRPMCWEDDLSWLPDPSIVYEFSGRISEFYTHAKAFHGCRPLSVASYYTHGILGQRSDQIIATFREVFSDLDRQDLDTAIAIMENREQTEGGKIWFVGDDKLLIQECGHYMIQGSEYLMALAASLYRTGSGNEDHRMRLRKFGTPTILEVDIPFNYIPSEQVVSIAKMILSAWGQSAAKKYTGFGTDDPSYVIHRNIEPSDIKAHYHPNIIADPHRGHQPYMVKNPICDVC